MLGNIMTKDEHRLWHRWYKHWYKLKDSFIASKYANIALRSYQRWKKTSRKDMSEK